jgi:hypothetical protein
MAHHQYTNDPQRDPDLAQLEGSGHHFHFPMPARRFLWECVAKQALWLPGLARYVRMRARYAMAGGAGPYAAHKPHPLVLLVGFLYVVALTLVMTGLAVRHEPWPLALVPLGMWAAVMTFYALVPEQAYSRTRLRPDLSMRGISVLRVTYMTLLITALAWLSHLTAEPWGLYYLVLWVLPLCTSFGFFMLTRELAHHGHAGRDRFDNTRVFLVGRLIRWAVFPLGMDYHLPHHLFPLVPHYRLPRLHDLLLRHDPEYRQHCTVVEGYFFHRHPPRHATVLEVMAQPTTFSGPAASAPLQTEDCPA